MKPKDPVWSNFVVLENINGKEQKAKCLNCNAMISARAPRLKSHVQKCGNFECGPNTPKKQTFLEMMMASPKSSQGMMDKYMLTIMVTFEQEYAIQKLFGRHGWEYSKITDEISSKKEDLVEKVSSETQPRVNQQSSVNETVPLSTLKIVTSNDDKDTKIADVKISVINDDVNNKLDNSINSKADALGDNDAEGDEDDDYGGDTDTEQSLESLGIVVKEEVDSEDDKTCENHADNISNSSSNVKISGKGKRVAQTKVVTSNRKKIKLATSTVTSAEAEDNVGRGEGEVKLEELAAENQEVDDPLAILETLPDIEHLSKVVSSDTHDVETFLTGPSDVDDSGYSVTLSAYFCKDCHYTFPEEKYYTLHKRSGKCVFQCQNCDKKYTFKNFSKYQEHLKQHRMKIGEVDSIDKLIEISFMNEDADTGEEKQPLDGSFVEVSTTEEYPYKCTVCGKVFNHRQSLHRHKQSHTIRQTSVLCEDCGKSYFSKQSLKVHRAMVHNKGIETIGLKKCPYPECDKKNFQTENMLQDHINSHLKIRTHKCSKCEKTYALRAERNRHENVCGRPGSIAVECKVCKKSFSSRSNLAIHSATHKNRIFFCTKCEKEFKYVTGLSKHKSKCEKT